MTLTDDLMKYARPMARNLLRLKRRLRNELLHTRENVDLHGSAPDKHEIALLLIDVINDFDFPGADQLLRYARPMARNLLRLKRRA